jgi:hypothetical protein
VLRNAHGDDTSFEAPYAVFALQMLPHAVGFLQKEPLEKKVKNEYNKESA